MQCTTQMHCQLASAVELLRASQAEQAEPHHSGGQAAPWQCILPPATQTDAGALHVLSHHSRPPACLAVTSVPILHVPSK